MLELKLKIQSNCMLIIMSNSLKKNVLGCKIACLWKIQSVSAATSNARIVTIE